MTGKVRFIWGGALMFCTVHGVSGAERRADSARPREGLHPLVADLGARSSSRSHSRSSAASRIIRLPFPAIFANTIADGVAAIGAVFALSLPVVVRLKYFSRPLLNKFLKYGVPLMGVSISVALLNQIDKYLVVGFYGNILYAYYSNNNSIASGLFTMISVGIMRGVYPAVLRALA